MVEVPCEAVAAGAFRMRMFASDFPWSLDGISSGMQNESADLFEAPLHRRSTLQIPLCSRLDGDPLRDVSVQTLTVTSFGIMVFSDRILS